MTSIQKFAGYGLQSIPMQKQQFTSSVNFKASGADSFERQSSLSEQDTEMMEMIKARKKEQTKAQKKQKWMNALQVGALVSSIALAGCFIYSMVKGGKGTKITLPEGNGGNIKKPGDFDISNLKFECFKDKKDIGDVRTTKTLSKEVQDFMVDMLDADNINAKYLKRAGLSNEALPNAGLLLGPPGTGKTEVVKMFAKASGGDYCRIKLSDFANSYVDGTATQMSKMFDELERKAAENPNKTFTVFFDEIDGFARKLGTIDSNNQHLGKNRQSFILGLDQLSKHKNIRIFGATNVGINDVDEAVISRLQKNITFDFPNKDQLYEGLKFHLRDVEGLESEGFNFFKDKEDEIKRFFEEEMVKKKGSYRDLEQIAKEARKKYASAMDKAKDETMMFDLDFLREALREKGSTSGELL